MALRDQPYFPFYVNDFISDEKLKPCSAESTGVYIRIMCELHKSEDYGAISFDELDDRTDDICYDFARKFVPFLPYAFDVIHRGLTELVKRRVLIIEGETLYQKRMVRDGNISDTRARAGSSGGLSKAEKYSKKLAKPVAKTKQNTGSGYDNENDIESEPTLDEVRFTEFWEAYPNKKGKKAALAAWKKAKVTKELHERILAAIRLQKTGRQWKKDNGQYIPNPATWINQGRWDDAVEPDKPGKGYSNPFLDDLRERGVIE